MSLARRLLSGLVMLAAGALLLACRHEQSEPVVKRDRTAVPSPAPARAPAPPAEHPVAVLAKLGPVIPEEPLTPPASPRVLKNAGGVGDLLEGDSYTFEARVVHPCGAPTGDVATPVVGAEIVITAKTRMSISPRHVVLARGGVAFHAHPVEARTLEGCTPLLRLGRLEPGGAARGFVLFDVPESELRPKGLALSYQPARFGGASAVQVSIEGW